MLTDGVSVTLTLSISMADDKKLGPNRWSRISIEVTSTAYSHDESWSTDCAVITTFIGPESSR